MSFAFLERGNWLTPFLSPISDKLEYQFFSSDVTSMKKEKLFKHSLSLLEFVDSI